MNISIRVGAIICATMLLGVGCAPKTKSPIVDQKNKINIAPTVQQTTSTSTINAPAQTAPPNTTKTDSTTKRQIVFYIALTKTISDAIDSCLKSLATTSAEFTDTQNCMNVIAQHDSATHLAAEPPLMQIRINIANASTEFFTNMAEIGQKSLYLFSDTGKELFRKAINQYSEKMKPIVVSINVLKKSYDISKQFEQDITDEMLNKLSKVPVNEGDDIVASCGKDETCIDQKFSRCQTATLTVRMGEKGYTFNIVSPTKDGLCSVKISDIVPSIEFLEPHTMNCSLPMSNNFTEDIGKVMLEVENNPKQTICHGSLVTDIITSTKLFSPGVM